MTEIERYRKALDVAQTVFDNMRQFSCRADAENASSALKCINAILNPPIEMEDVPIERWVCLKCGKSYEHEASLCSCYPTGSSTDSYVPVKLTGTLTRPKPVKVERSVSGIVEWEESQERLVIPLAADSPLLSFRDLIGKRGTMTFTWAE